LGSLPGDWFDERVISSLIDDDLDLYRRFLSIPRTSDQRLAPLCGASKAVDFEMTPNLGRAWAEKAMLALDHGYTPEDVAQATFGRFMSWRGKTSDMWNAWVVQFDSMLTHPDRRIQLVAEIGRAQAARNRDHELRSERATAVYEFD
jgi:hypothetical protein